MNRKQRRLLSATRKSSRRRNGFVTGATATGVLASSVGLMSPAIAAGINIGSCSAFNSSVSTIAANGGVYNLNFSGTCVTTEVFVLNSGHDTVLNGPSTGNLTFDIGTGKNYFVETGATNLTVNNIDFTVSDGHTITDVFATYTSQPTLTLSDVSIHDVTSVNSGAIYVEGNLNVSNSAFYNLNSSYNATAINLPAGFSQRATITNSTFHDNGATSSSELGVIDSAGSATLTITGTAFADNRNENAGSGAGGALTLRGTGTVNVTNSTFTRNMAGFAGGAIFSLGGTLHVKKSTFESNSTSDRGGAIYSNQDVVTIEDSTFDSNSSQGNGGAGAIYSEGSLSVNGSTFYENLSPAGLGGAISVPYTVVDVQNSTFVGNSAADGGALFSEGGVVSNSTFWNNAAGANTGNPTAASVVVNGGTLFANILANSISTPLLETSLNDAGANLYTDDSFVKTTSGDGASKKVSFASLKLKALALNKTSPSNFGKTKTVALGEGSSAIDFYSATSSGIAPTYNNASRLATRDQRGAQRPAGGKYDVGAYEVGTPATVTHKTILFHGDSAKLTPHAKNQLRALAKSVQAQGVHSITLDGHTATLTKADPAGRKLRGKIAGARTRAVEKFLKKQFKKSGYSVTITRVIKGAADPVKSNRTEKGRKANRRVYITIK